MIHIITVLKVEDHQIITHPGQEMNQISHLIDMEKEQTMETIQRIIEIQVGPVEDGMDLHLHRILIMVNVDGMVLVCVEEEWLIMHEKVVVVVLDMEEEDEVVLVVPVVIVVIVIMHLA